MSIYILTVQSLSQRDLLKLKRLIESDSLVNISIFELKHKMTIVQILKYMFSIRGEVFYLNSDGENVKYLQQILNIFCLTAFRAKYDLISDEKIISKSWASLFISTFSLFYFMIKNLYLSIISFVLLSAIKPKKSEIVWSRVSTIFYLKTNLWFGIKAGGSIGHISGVVNSLSKKFKIKYITCEEPILINEDNVEFIDLNKFQNICYAPPFELNQLQLANMFYKFLKKEKKKIQCIYQRLTIYNYSGALVSRLFNIPLILEYNGSEVWIQQNWSQGLKYPKLASMIENFCLNQATKIITVSEELKKDLLTRGIEETRIACYPNCIDPEKYNYKIHDHGERKTVRDSLGFKDDELVFTFVGTFGVWHGVEFMAQAINEFLSENKCILGRFKFLLIGGGVLFDKVKSQLKEAELDGHVIFTGIVPQDQTRAYLNASDIFLSPHIERKGEVFFGSPTKLFEYMSYAKPIIASSLYQIKDVFNKPLFSPYDNFSSESDGVLFKPNSVEEFKNAIEYCLKLDEQSRKQIGHKSYENVMENYTWDQHVAQLWSEKG